MDLKQLFFSFDGRIRRLHYWLGLIGAMVAYGVLGVVVGIILGIGMRSQGGAPLGILAIVLFVGLLFLAAWTGLALQIKRWHDRDKSWVWIFIAFIPIIGAFWVLIECGFLDGTQGSNKYGPSPKGIAGPAPAAAATT